MATYTMRLGAAIEATGGTADRVNGMTHLRDTNIGLEHYPIFDEAHRDTLNSHIVDRYWNSEIAHETIPAFRLALSAHMNLHMPTFNEQYRAALVKYDPLRTVDMETTGESVAEQEARTTGTSSSEAKGNSKARNINSEFPQTMLAGDEDYASAGVDASSWSENSGSDSQEGVSDNKSRGESRSRSTGYSVYPAQLVRLRQDLVLNVDLLVVQSMQELFFGLWMNSDEYSGNGYPYGY